MIGKMPGTSVHWGFLVGLLLCGALSVLMSRTTFGFAARVTGGNFRAALAQGLPVGRLIVACSAIAGACAGLAGFFEVAAIQGRANASLAAGYGFTGILVAFLARHNPLVIPPVAIMFGGIVAAGGLVQRRMGLPDATVQVLEGFIFIVLLTSETLYGRFAIFKPRGRADGINPALIVLVAMLGGAIRVSTPFMFVALGETPDGKIRAREPRPRRHARARRHVSPTPSPIRQTARGSASWRRASRVRRSARCTARSAGLPRVNDVAVGIAMMLFGVGIAFFFGKPYIQPHRAAPRLDSASGSGPTAPTCERAQRQPAVLRRHPHRDC